MSHNLSCQAYMRPHMLPHAPDADWATMTIDLYRWCYEQMPDETPEALDEYAMVSAVHFNPRPVVCAEGRYILYIDGSMNAMSLSMPPGSRLRYVERGSVEYDRARGILSGCAEHAKSRRKLGDDYA